MEVVGISKAEACIFEVSTTSMHPVHKQSQWQLPDLAIVPWPYIYMPHTCTLSINFTYAGEEPGVSLLLTIYMHDDFNIVRIH